MDFMNDCKDKQFDLAIPDPIYMDGLNTSTWVPFRGIAQKEYINNTNNLSVKTKPDYFIELFRVSKSQIIWGGNYFVLPISRGWIVWDKDNGDNNFSDCELAWTSFDKILKKFKYKWHGMLQENMKNKEKRIHPTQKPVALYKWLLKNYAQPGWTIFDSHVGSGSLRIACHDMGFDFVGCELDSDYWQAQEDRYKNHIANRELFDVQEIQDNIFNQVRYYDNSNR